MRLLIVEAERKMAELLKQGLEEKKYRVRLAFNGRTGLELATFFEFDAIVLDLMLSVLDGFEVVRGLRRNHNQTPILVLTARDAITDIAKALDLGADDFLTKPISFVELLARLRAIVRRGSGSRSPFTKVADLVLDPATRRVCRGSHEIHLSPTEYKVLESLMRHTGRVVSRDAIVECVWGLDRVVQENTLDAFVRLLRGKVDRGFRSKLIQTMRGVGYSIHEKIEP